MPPANIITEDEPLLLIPERLAKLLLSSDVEILREAQSELAKLHTEWRTRNTASRASTKARLLRT